jgi:hypothetical protein
MSLPTSAFDTTKSIVAGLSVIVFKPTNARLTAVTGEADDELLTKTGHGLTTGDAFTFVSGTGFTGLVAGTIYYAIVASSATFKAATTLANALAGTAIDITADGSAGVIAPTLIFEAAKLDAPLEQTEGAIERPDSLGVAREVRTWISKQQESFTFALDEAKRLLDIFASSLAGRRVGTVTLYLPDPDNTTGTVALKSEADFACTVYRDGPANFGGGAATIPTIRIKSNKQGLITWTKDASV